MFDKVRIYCSCDCNSSFLTWKCFSPTETLSLQQSYQQPPIHLTPLSPLSSAASLSPPSLSAAAAIAVASESAQQQEDPLTSATPTRIVIPLSPRSSTPAIFQQQR